MHISGRQFFIGVVGLFVCLYCVHLYTQSVVKEELLSTSFALDASIAKQELVLMTIADLTKQNKADEITERIVIDCKDDKRQRFETLLDKLSGNISRNELIELDQLFFECGSFYADRKSVMAARLTREVSVYQDYISLRDGILESRDSSSNRVALWQRIADDELKLAEGFTRLVDAQRSIIMALLAGKNRDSIEIVNTLTDVTEIKADMSVLVQQIENTRKELQSI